MRNRLKKRGAITDIGSAAFEGLGDAKSRLQEVFAGMSPMVACLGFVAFVCAAAALGGFQPGGGKGGHGALAPAAEQATAFGAAPETNFASPGLTFDTARAIGEQVIVESRALQAAFTDKSPDAGDAAAEQILGLGPVTLEDFPNRLIAQELKTRPDFTFHRLGDGKGPVMLVVGGIQGDEPGGFSAASLLVTHYNITRGTVWVVPNLNFLSILGRDRGADGDMNRKFAALSPDDPEYETVVKIKDIILKPEVEAVFNLHDGSGFYRPQWEGPLHNPARWGQSVIIDQEELFGHPLGGLKDLADYAVDRANAALLEPEHRYHLKNTNTSAGDKEMEKTLTYFAICNGKPAFGVEASKNVPLPVRAYYHAQVLESFMHQLGISFVRRFELSPAGVSDALEENTLISFADGRVALPLFNARANLNHIPLQRGEKLEFHTASPILTLKENKGLLEVHYGNRILTKLAPDYHDYDTSLPGLAIQIDGARQEVPFGREVLVDKNSKFLVENIPGYRVNVIGYVGKSDDESNEELRLKQFMPRFSLDNAGTAYRVEVYRADKAAKPGQDKDSFAGMITVRFADPAAALQAKGSSLPAVPGRETELGW